MYGWKDRMRDWFREVGDRLQLTKEAWARIGIAAGIALILTAIIFGVAISGVRGSITRQGDELGGDIANVAAQTSDDIAAIEAQTQAAINSTAAQLTDMELALAGMEDYLSGNVTQLWRRIMDGEDWLAEHEAILAQIPRAQLTGGAGNYTLHVEAGTSGNYAARVHLVYSPVTYNATSHNETIEEFYADVDWAQPGVPAYICDAAYNGTAWGIAEVWFSIAPFAVEAGERLAFDVDFVGLSPAWVPAYVYVDVFEVA